MRITIRAGGLFAKHLPDNRRGDTAEMEVAPGATPASILEQLELNPEGRYLIIVNDQVVPPSSLAETVLAEGDHLSIMPPLKGG